MKTIKYKWANTTYEYYNEDTHKCIRTCLHGTEFTEYHIRTYGSYNDNLYNAIVDNSIFMVNFHKYLWKFFRNENSIYYLDGNIIIESDRFDNVFATITIGVDSIIAKQSISVVTNKNLSKITREEAMSLIKEKLSEMFDYVNKKLVTNK